MLVDEVVFRDWAAGPTATPSVMAWPASRPGPPPRGIEPRSVRFAGADGLDLLQRQCMQPEAGVDLADLVEVVEARQSRRAG